MNMTGIKDAQYLAQFLGKLIAIKARDALRFDIYKLTAIFSIGTVEVTDKSGGTHFFEWSECENPYLVLNMPSIMNISVEFK